MAAAKMRHPMRAGAASVSDGSGHAVVPVVTLLTDFGREDAYVGAMKGVMLGINPQVRIVDISHAIPPRNLTRAACIAVRYHRCFPPRSVHVIVVDPGVGSDRDIVALRVDGHVFLAPDNGVLTLLLQSAGAADVYRVENRILFRHPVSATFHGRDIFAPVAAHLAGGMALEEVGCALCAADLKTLKLAAPTVSGRTVAGVVTAVDHFGNLLTNIGRELLSAAAPAGGGRRFQVRVAGQRIQGVFTHYAAAAEGCLMALVDSDGYLEIAVRGGSAADRLGAGPGDAVVLAAFCGGGGGKTPENHES